MSRIGKKPVTLPEGVTASLDGKVLTIKGKNGEESMSVHHAVDVKISEGEITVEKLRNAKIGQAMWGTTQRLIENMVVGVTEGFKKTLILDGVGFRMALKGQQVDLALGFSHPVLIDIPEGIKVEIDKMNFIVTGADKQKVGQFAAEIRSLKPVEPYKGKGFRYDDEIVRRKEGKKAAA